jgi:hypothetical protein
MCVSSGFVHATSFLDPGPHGSGRYSPEMFPEIERRDFRKGAQVHLCCISSVFYKKQFMCGLIQSLVGKRLSCFSVSGMSSVHAGNLCSTIMWKKSFSVVVLL